MAKKLPISEEAVRKATGKNWKQWCAVLDKAGARRMPHREIAAYLYKSGKISGWWSQMVAVGYEQIRGLREKHEKPDGFSVSVSRTVEAPVASAFRAWKDGTWRRRWLGGMPLEIRKATPSKSMRITWADRKTSLEVNFYVKGEGKSQVVVQHSKLPDARTASRMKACWGRSLDKMKGVLER